MWDQGGQPPQSAPSQVDQGKVQPGSQTPVQQAQLTIQAVSNLKLFIEHYIYIYELIINLKVKQ